MSHYSNAFMAAYSDLKNVKTRGVVQIVLEMPQEYGTKFVQAFGLPNPSSEVWFGIAKINPDATTQAEEKPYGEKLVQRAAILCTDKDFITFMGAEDTAEALRLACGISSRRELATNQAAQEEFKILLGQFEEWKRFGPQT